MIKKIFGVLAVIVLVCIIGYIALAVSASSSCSGPKESKLPEISPPYYLVTTDPPSLVYVGKEVDESIAGVLIKRPYLVKIGGNWKVRDGEVILNRDAYKDINVELLTAP